MTEWVNSVTTSKLTCFNRFIRTLVNYQEQITHYFIARHTSGFVEGFNNRVKVLKRRCYGLSEPTKLFQRLLVDTTGMTRFAPGVTGFKHSTQRHVEPKLSPMLIMLRYCNVALSTYRFTSSTLRQNP